MRLVGKLAGFSYQCRSRLKPIRKRCSDNKSPCLNADNQIDLAIREMISNQINRGTEGFAISQERRDVFEEDSLLWKIGDIPDLLLEPFNGYDRCSSKKSQAMGSP